MGIIKLKSPVFECFPKQVTSALVGLVLPCQYFHTRARMNNIMTGEALGPVAVYIVSQVDVMHALREHHRDVEQYFNHIGMPKGYDSIFGFWPKSVIEIRKPMVISAFPKKV